MYRIHATRASEAREVFIEDIGAAYGTADDLLADGYAITIYDEAGLIEWQHPDCDCEACNDTPT